jgi:hypothetical protein
VIGVPMKAKLTTLGLLSKLLLQHTTPEGYNLDILYRQTNESTKAALEAIGDIKSGVDIGSNVLLRFSSKDDHELLKRFPDPNDRLRYELNSYVLETSREVDIESEKPCNLDDDWDYLKKNIKNVNTAFRLLKPDFIETTIKIESARPGPPELHMYSDHGINNHVDGFLFWSPQHGPFILNLTEISEVRSIANKLSEIDFNKRRALRIAIDRFEKTYYEDNFEDYLIDCMIAFEALLVGKKSVDQGAVIPIAAAMLIGKFEVDRQDIIKTLEFAYKIRNCIVHGSEYESKFSDYPKDTFKLTIDLESILRNCIKKLI